MNGNGGTAVESFLIGETVERPMSLLPATSCCFVPAGHFALLRLPLASAAHGGGRRRPGHQGLVFIGGHVQYGETPSIIMQPSSASSSYSSPRPVVLNPIV